MVQLDGLVEILLLLEALGGVLVAFPQLSMAGLWLVNLFHSGVTCIIQPIKTLGLHGGRSASRSEP